MLGQPGIAGTARDGWDSQGLLGQPGIAGTARDGWDSQGWFPRNKSVYSSTIWFSKFSIVMGNTFAVAHVLPILTFSSFGLSYVRPKKSSETKFGVEAFIPPLDRYNHLIN